MISRSKKYLLNIMNGMSSKTQLGTELRCKVSVLKGVIDISAQGAGAVGLHNILDEDGNALVLPKGAIVRQSYTDIVTAFTSTAGTGTIALGINTAVDNLAAVDADTLSAVSANIPVGTGATMVKTTADRNLTYTVATNALLTGKMNVFYEFVLSSEIQ